MTHVVVPLSQAQPSAKPLMLAVVTNFLMHLLLGVLCAWFARRAHGLKDWN
jgi:predicted cobalt transporter CbtA